MFGNLVGNPEGWYSCVKQGSLKMFVILLFQEDKYNLNVCGEGGEYETFTLDCPLFKKEIVM